MEIFLRAVLRRRDDIISPRQGRFVNGRVTFHWNTAPLILFALHDHVNETPFVISLLKEGLREKKGNDY